MLSTVAGYKTFNQGSTADGILATDKKVIGPLGLRVDKEGNFFIAAKTVRYIRSPQVAAS